MTFIPGKLILAKEYIYGPADPDVAAYIAAVETADGQGLEEEVKAAYASFITGCKSDGIWDAIKASCILAGARTLDGALVPLVGTAPTNNGPFVAADYNRKTGLAGNGSTKYLRTGLNNNSLPRNSRHLSVYSSVAPTLVKAAYIGVFPSVSASSYFYINTNRLFFNLTEASEGGIVGNPTGFIGCSRSQSASYPFRVQSVSYTRNETSSAPGNMLFDVYRINSATPSLYSDARIAFYSIGEALPDLSPTQTGLALLDARVSTLISDLGAAIP